jgi:hypothetical protein
MVVKLGIISASVRFSSRLSFIIPTGKFKAACQIDVVSQSTSVCAVSKARNRKHISILNICLLDDNMGIILESRIWVANI